MTGIETPRFRAFAFGLALLALGTAALALGDRGAVRDGHTASPEPGGRGQAAPARSLAAVRIATGRFARAYLAYERGVLDAVVERAISRYAIPRFAGQLLAAPVRLPPGRRPPVQRVAGIVGPALGLLEGEPALLMGVRTMGEGDSQLLRVSLVRRERRWLVAGLGP